MTEAQESVLVHGHKFELIISKQQIEEKIDSLAHELMKFRLAKPTFVITLKGAFFFGTELIKRFDQDCSVEFIRTSSYHGMESTSDFKMTSLDALELSGRDVILVEDLIDTGQTLHKVQSALKSYNYASLTTITLLRKPSAIKFPASVDLIGFDIEDAFVVGYGLDYNEAARNLQGIYQKV